MQLISLCLTVGIVVGAYAEPQFYGGGQAGYPNDPFRSYNPYPSSAGAPYSSFQDGQQSSQDDQLNRFVGLQTIRWVSSTSTTTSYLTLTTTCTRSTASIRACSPSGRRRRGLALSGKSSRSLFFEDEEPTDSSSVISQQENEDTKKEQQRAARDFATDSLVPYVVQPGFNAPGSMRSARFLVAYGVEVKTLSTTTYVTRTLTAFCRSVTNFPTC